jgi:hypothetical protein
MLCAVLAGGLTLQGHADETPKGDAPKPAEAGTLVLVDSAGKEHKIKKWKFTAGVRRLSWLAGADKPKDKDGAKDAKARAVPPGPEAFVLREGEKIVLVEGVLTFVPLDRLRSLEFDAAEKTVKARVATSDKPEDDLVLTGTTRFAGINKLTIEAEVDKGEDGIASITYQAGVLKSNLRAVRFPAPKVPAAAAGGRAATVQTADKDVKATHKVTDLKALYRTGRGAERLLPTLMFKKTLKVDLKKVKKITSSSDDESDDVIWRVTRDDEELSLTLLTTLPRETKPADLAGARLVGLLGKAPAGYKLFPARTITGIDFNAEKEKEKEDI